MAGNYIVINSKFKPFSYEEMVRPYQRYGETYREQEALLSDIQSRAGTLEGSINPVLDENTYKEYKTYQDDLARQAELLSRQGLNVGSRKDLLNMRNRYSTEITPIETAINRRKSLIEEQRQGRIKDGSIIYDTDFSTTSLDKLKMNPTMSYRALSGQELSKRSAMMAESLKGQILNNPEYTSILNGQYFQSKIQQGATLDQVLAGMMNDENAPREFKEIKNQLWKEYGLDTYSQDVQQKAMGAIGTGMYNALGATKYDVMANQDHMTPYQAATNRRAQDQADREAEIYTNYTKPKMEYEKQLYDFIPLTNGNYARMGQYGKIQEYVKDESGNYKLKGYLDSKDSKGLDANGIDWGSESITMKITNLNNQNPTIRVAGTPSQSGAGLAEFEGEDLDKFKVPFRLLDTYLQNKIIDQYEALNGKGSFDKTGAVQEVDKKWSFYYKHNGGTGSKAEIDFMIKPNYSNNSDLLNVGLD